MSLKFDQKKYDGLKSEFSKAIKRVRVSKSPHRKLTEDESKLSSYKESIIETYNRLVEYIAIFYSRFKEENKIIFKDRITHSRGKVVECFDILNLTYHWPQNSLELIDIEQVAKSKNSQSEIANSSDALNRATSSDSIASDEVDDPLSNIDNLMLEETEVTGNGEEGNQSDTQNNLENNSDNIDNITTMVQSTSEFLKLAASILNYKFAGDPLKLESFITDIELVDELAEAANKDICLKFIKSKLEGKALECMPEAVNTIEAVTDALKAEIKPENSSIIEGKMLALRLEKGNLSKFSEQAEKLAEAFRRTLIVEGISKAKAQEMTINKTIEICRKTARSETVKSVLAAKTFESPSEVVAKFVTENTIARREYKEAQSFKGKRFPNNNSNNNRQPNKSNNRNFDNRNNGGVRPNNNRYNNNNNNGGNNNRQNNNFNNNRRFNNNNNNRQNNNYHRQNNNRHNGGNEHTIRIMTGNHPGPSSDGDNRNEVFHVPMN